MLALLLAERPKVVSFHFGVPSRERIEALKDAGIVLLGSATSIADARALVAAGIDAVIAQGYEAGGHRGVFDPDADDDRLGTFALTRLLVRAIDRPVIAAGGLMDGAGIAAALRLGASAAQLGTAFVACDESEADAGYRAALKSDATNHTVMTRAFSGRPARSLANRFTALGRSVAPRDVPDYPVAYDAAKALHAAGKAKGEFGYGAQWAGQGAPLSRAMPAADSRRAPAARDASSLEREGCLAPLPPRHRLQQHALPLRPLVEPGPLLGVALRIERSRLDEVVVASDKIVPRELGLRILTQHERPLGGGLRRGTRPGRLALRQRPPADSRTSRKPGARPLRRAPPPKAHGSPAVVCRLPPLPRASLRPWIARSG